MFKLSAAALAVMTSAYAFAADPVTDTMHEAYAPYRAALFRTNSNSQIGSQQAIKQAQQAWNELVAQFGARPAAPYDRDPAFAASLAAVIRHGAQARAVLEALLQKYQDEGVTGLDDPRILKIAPFDAMGTPVELLKTFGGRDGFEKAVHELQAALYRSAA